MSATSLPSASEWRALIARFQLGGSFVSASPHGSGHINDTYAVTLDQAGTSVRYIFQRINDRIFRDVPALMDNIARVTRHLAGKLAGGPDCTRRTLTVVPARDGQPHVHDAALGWWRCYWFIERAASHDLIREPAQAREAARGFGQFQELLADLGGPRLHETIPAFHDTSARFRRLMIAAEKDAHDRLATVRAELRFAQERESEVTRLLDLHSSGEIPERVTHNDTKLNNVMLDDATGASVCVIDLDTVMPGLALYDFGDMVRTATNSAAEDETNLSLVHAREEFFTALVEGYLATARPFLTSAEIEHLTFAGRLMTFEVGIRFLTDHLEGDVYFKIKHPGHNLDRARNQFALLRSLESQDATFRAIVARHL